MKKLRQKRWFRNLFPNQTYYFINGAWVKDSKFNVGDKIENISGKFNSACFCECGNELSHSESFISENKENGVWEYKCTHCGKHQYANGTLGPFILQSDKNGEPISFKEKA